MVPPPAIKASAVLRPLPRFLITTLEPLAALGGVFLAVFAPYTYASETSRHLVSSIDPATEFVYTQLAGAWMVIVFCEAVLLRQVDDVKVWRLVCIAILLSDAFYTHSMAQAVGGWEEWLVLGNWTVNDWVAAAGTFPFIATRLAIVLGVGYRR